MKKGYYHLISSVSRRNQLLSDRECEDSDELVVVDDDDSSVRSDEDCWDVEAEDLDAKMPPREEVEKKERRKKKVEKRFLRNLFCRLTRSKPGDKASFTDVALPSAVHYLMHNRDGGLMSSDAIYQRLKLAKSCGMFGGEILGALVEGREKLLANRGNKSGNHHSASAADTKTLRSQLEKLKRNEERFIIQAAGNSDASGRTWAREKGEDKDAPLRSWDPDSIPDGSPATFSVNMGKISRRYPTGWKHGACNWDRKLYVPGTTFNTLYDQTTGNRESEYRLRYDNQSVHLDPSGHRPEVVNTHNFVIVWFEKMPFAAC